MRLERLHEPLLPTHAFRRRLAAYGGVAMLLIGVSLGIGVLGYHLTAGLGWVDSILNASMILAGMGQVDTLHATSAKLFASFYAIFSGVAFLTSVGLLLAPVGHRILHHLHLDADDESGHKPRRR